MMMCIQNLVSFCQFVLKTLSKNQNLTSIKGCNPVANLRKTMIYISSKKILSMLMNIQNLVLFCQFILKILSKNQILTSIKGRNSVANLRKIKIYNTHIDLVNDDVYTKFSPICLFVLKILSKKQILTSIKGRNSVANLRKN